MKNNTEKTKIHLQKALVEAPEDFALSEVRSHIRAALNKLEQVETKRIQREQDREKRAEKAALAAINSPLLEVSIHGAKGVLFAISGGDDLTINEIQEAAKIITESDRKSTRLNSSHIQKSRMPSSA